MNWWQSSRQYGTGQFLGTQEDGVVIGILFVSRGDGAHGTSLPHDFAKDATAGQIAEKATANVLNIEFGLKALHGGDDQGDSLQFGNEIMQFLVDRQWCILELHVTIGQSGASTALHQFAGGMIPHGAGDGFHASRGDNGIPHVLGEEQYATAAHALQLFVGLPLVHGQKDDRMSAENQRFFRVILAVVIVVGQQIGRQPTHGADDLVHLAALHFHHEQFRKSLQFRSIRQVRVTLRFVVVKGEGRRRHVRVRVVVHHDAHFARNERLVAIFASHAFAFFLLILIVIVIVVIVLVLVLVGHGGGRFFVTVVQ